MALELLTYNDKYLLKGGEFVLAEGGEGCCCDGGCCPTTLLETTVLIAEIIGTSGGASACFAIGSKRELINASGIWTIDGISACWEEPTWMGLSLSCVINELNLTWDTNSLCGCPETPGPWILISGQCDPLEFIFTTTLIADIACPCDDGTITVKITKKP